MLILLGSLTDQSPFDSCSPLIASKYFFGEGNSHSNTNVQYVYLAVSILGVIVATAYFFTKLPEPEELDSYNPETTEILTPSGEVESKKATYIRIAAAFITQFMYVGAQVTIGAFFLNYAEDNGGYNPEKGAQMLSYGLITFTVGRFIGTALLAFVSAPLLLAVYSIACAILICAISSVKGGSTGVICLIVIMFFEVSSSAIPAKIERELNEMCHPAVDHVPSHFRFGYRQHGPIHQARCRCRRHGC